jgi:CHASE3 domain sensor protein
MKSGIRSRLYGGFAALAVLSVVMGGFAYRQLDSLDDMFKYKGQIEHSARDLYTVNGLTERFIAQSRQYRTTSTPEAAAGMQSSLSEMARLAEGLTQRASNEERRKLYKEIHTEATRLATELPKLIELGTQIRENRDGVYTSGDDLTAASGGPHHPAPVRR